MLILAILGVILLVDIGCLVADQFVGAYLAWIVALVGSYLFIPEAANIVHNTGWVYFLVHRVSYYLVAGFVVALAEWMWHNFKVAGRIRELKVRFDEKFNLASTKASAGVGTGARNDHTYSGVSDASWRRYAFLAFWNNATTHSHNVDMPDPIQCERETIIIDKLTPKAKDHVADITIWILQWPLVLIATVFEDVLINIGKHFASFCDAIFSRSSRALIGWASKGI